MQPKLDQYTMDAVMATFEAKGLVVVEKEAAAQTARFYAKKKNLLKSKWVSACAVADYGLLNTKPTRKTVKNMIADGRIMDHETYIKGSVHMVLVEAIHRLNNNN